MGRVNTEVRLENRTPHNPLVVFGMNGGSVSLPCEGEPVRLSEERSVASTLAISGVTIAVVEQSYGEPELLPPPTADVWHVVSQLVVNALPDRSDLLFPVDLVRDEFGNVVGCRALARSAAGQR
jgi:hypothetical protein